MSVEEPIEATVHIDLETHELTWVVTHWPERTRISPGAVDNYFAGIMAVRGRPITIAGQRTYRLVEVDPATLEWICELVP